MSETPTDSPKAVPPADDSAALPVAPAPAPAAAPASSPETAGAPAAPAGIPPTAAQEIASPDLRTPMERRMANLKPPWPAGTSGNRRGKKKGTPSITGSIKRFLKLSTVVDNPITGEKGLKMKVADRIALRLVVKAANGDRGAINDIINRTDGEALRRVEVTGKDGQPLNPAPDISEALDGLTVEDLRALANRGRPSA